MHTPLSTAWAFRGGRQQELGAAWVCNGGAESWSTAASLGAAQLQANRRTASNIWEFNLHHDSASPVLKAQQQQNKGAADQEWPPPPPTAAHPTHAAGRWRSRPC